MASGEAIATDPQQRILLEETATALADAGGRTGNAVSLSAGVYVGCMYHEYVSEVVGSGMKLSSQAFIGNGPPYMVGRVSYTFGLTGPCVSTDTACSSSLVAAHLGHQGLLNWESEAAVIGGLNLMIRAETTAGICQLQALSPVGRCQSFDASADGYGRGEGFAAIVLQRSQQASNALAVLSASAVNQDGRYASFLASFIAVLQCGALHLRTQVL